MIGLISSISVCRNVSAKLSAALLLSVFLTAFNTSAAEIRADAGVPINFTADEIVHNRDLGIITASGNVEVTYGARTLYADTISYNERQDLVSASGNIRLMEANGDVLFADYMELSQDMREGTIKALRVLLSDRSRMAGAEARRIGGNRHELDRGIYTACEPCKENPAKPPLWQVKAVRIIHDVERETIEYRDAWLEVAGVPVAYTPYFLHPDPTIKRRTGFLTPNVGSSSRLGQFIQTPFFWNLGPNQDLTLVPLITSSSGAGLGGEYRFLGHESEIKGKFSGAYTDYERARGHIDMKGRVNLTDTWRAGLNAQGASDDSYTREYGYQSLPVMTTRAYAEGFRGRNYLAANAYTFQDMRANTPSSTSPFVLPLVEYSHLGEPTAGGGRTRLDASMLAFTRSAGADVRRLSFAPGWDLPYVGPAGDIYKLSLTLRGDVYHVNGHEYLGRADSFNGTTGRFHPEAAFEWRYPFVRRHETITEVLEPITSLVVSPYGGNPVRIPNDDSREILLDETNLFAARRYPGLDRVDGGPRFNYGLRWGIFGDQGGRSSVFVGQSVRARTDNAYAMGSGMEDHLSDVIARVDIKPLRFMNLIYRTQLDKDGFSPTRSEVGGLIGTASLNFGANYLFFNQVRGSEFPTQEQLALSINSQIARNWKISFASLQDLHTNDLRSLSFLGAYEDECLVLALTANRSLFYDRDLKPDDSIVARITFKTLGEIGQKLY
ncbi:MAG: LPS-assembly protein LptD [Alphaproteobacteria bacterium]|nr:LPS-assembly protein LptD [Alphaproteobacteria bacterium]